nr:MAG TPA: hypothetical protein [Caudoviricetes sp.]
MSSRNPGILISGRRQMWRIHGPSPDPIIICEKKKLRLHTQS